MSIVLQDLVKRYGSNLIVDHVSLEIADGELFVLLGASGSGKSTILRMIAGLLPMDGGRVSLHGRDVTHLTPQQRNVGFVFQNYSLFRHMTVAENIEFGLDIRKAPKAQRAAKRDELLDLIGLAGLGGRFPRQLSGGQQQRVAVARALAFEPSVLLLDEPFGALDVKIRAQLRQTLRNVQRQLGVTTILVTHDQEEAFELADRIGVVDRGHLLEVGPPADLYRRPQHEFVAQFLGSATLLDGHMEDGKVQVGSLNLPVPDALASYSPAGQAAVLFRPEDLRLAASPDEVRGPLLGRGEVEEVQFLGTLQKLRVRLEPTPGIRSLVTDYGEAGVPLQVAQLPRVDGQPDFEAGQTVWVGIKTFHLMPRTAPRLLLCLDDACDAAFARGVTKVLDRATAEGPITLLAVAETQAKADECLAAAQKFLPTLPALTTATRVGQAAEAILAEIHEGDYDLAIVRETPKAQEPHRPGTTLAEQVAREAPIPVLVVKGNRPTIRRVLLCTAGGEPGKQDVLVGGRLARRMGASTTLLYVDPATAQEQGTPWSATGRANGLVQRHLEQGRQTLQNQGLRAEVKVRRGAVPTEILAEAAEGDYDLVVVGGHLPSATRSFGEGEHDLATEVVGLSDRSVLVVRGSLNR